jgi:hypothetical protein
MVLILLLLLGKGQDLDANGSNLFLSHVTMLLGLFNSHMLYHV